jgi:hypothetical protein
VIALPDSDKISATVKWTQPSGQGTPILGYRVYSKIHGTSNPYVMIYDGSRRADLLEFTLIGILEGQNLDISVTAINQVGESALSVPLELIPAAAPDPPKNLRIVSQNSGSISVAWEASQDDNGALL